MARKNLHNYSGNRHNCAKFEVFGLVFKDSKSRRFEFYVQYIIKSFGILSGIKI